MSASDGGTTGGSDQGRPWSQPEPGHESAPGYGQPPGSPPQYGAQPPWTPGGPPPTGWHPPPTPSKTSGMAIAALVLAILWLCGLGSLVAIILGIVALGQIKRSAGTLGGRGLAIAGIAVGGVGLLLMPLFAAIAIPVFLNQREKAWDAAAKSDLRNASLMQESYFTDNSTYATDIEELEAEGFDPSVGVTLTIARADARSYCLEAKHESSTQYWHYDSTVFVAEEGRC